MPRRECTTHAVVEYILQTSYISNIEPQAATLNRGVRLTLVATRTAPWLGQRHQTRKWTARGRLNCCARWNGVALGLHLLLCRHPARRSSMLAVR